MKCLVDEIFASCEDLGLHGCAIVAYNLGFLAWLIVE